MPKASPGQHSFAGGEFSPLLEGRQDLEKYPVACRRLRNFLPLIQGPARKRGGTQFIAEVKDSTKRTWLMPFVFSESDAVAIEFGDTYNRFFTDRGTIESAPNTPYEITAPYASTDLLHVDGSFDLSSAQSGDVLFLANDAYKPRTLSRTSNTSWAYADYSPNDGPFDLQNIDTTVSVTVSAATGTVTLTNDAAGIPVAESATSVARLIRIEETDKSAIKPWEASKRTASEGENPVGELRRSDGKVYSCATNSVVGVGRVEYRTGTIRPVHTEGTEGDGDGEALYSGSTLFAGRVGLDWTYLHPGYGIGRIASVASGGLTASVTVLSRFPASIITPGSYRWSLGAWYSGNYPSSVAFFRDRLSWMGRQRVWISVAANYTSMALDEFGEVLADSAIDITVSIGQVDQINWAISLPDALLIGTGGSEIALHEISQSQVFGPANCKFEAQSSYGSRRVAPLNVAEFTLFVQAGGRKLRTAQYSFERERYVARDLTAFSEHITRSGLVDMAYAKNPNSVVWCVRADGLLAALTYQPDENVEAWSLHDVGGAVESIAVIPGPITGVDDLWMIVRREIDGETKRYVEVLLQPHESPNDPWRANYQDCALTYDGSLAATLTPGAGATVLGTTGVSFTASAAVLVSGDVGREIHYRYYNEDSEEWYEAVASIDAFTSTTLVTGTILVAFPALTAIAAGEWGLSATEITGLDHLEGETVRIVADGAPHDSAVVSLGTVALTRPGHIVHVGLPNQAVLQLMNLEAGAGDGTAQGKIKRISTVGFQLFETMGGKYGPNVGKLSAFEYRKPVNAMTRALPLYSGLLSVPWNNGYEIEGRITFVHDDGLPCTVCAIYPQLKTEDTRTGGTY